MDHEIDIDDDNNLGCMPNAINHYFGFRIFTSLEHFVEEQRAICRRLHVRFEHDLHFALTQRMKVHCRIYRRCIIYSSRRNERPSWTSLLAPRHTRAIIHYKHPNNLLYHAEAISICESRISLLRYPGITELPGTDLTFEQFLGKCYGLNRNQYYMAIFIFIQ